MSLLEVCLYYDHSILLRHETKAFQMLLILVYTCNFIGACVCVCVFWWGGGGYYKPSKFLLIPWCKMVLEGYKSILVSYYTTVTTIFPYSISTQHYIIAPH